MNTETQKIIDERLSKLPPYIKTTLDNIKWGEEILAIGKKHGLHVDEMGILQTETVMVLVGLVHPDEYPKNLKQELHIPREKIDEIVNDINEHILKNVRQALIDFLTTEEKGEQPVPVLTPPPTTAPTPIISTIPTQFSSPQQAAPENILKKTGIELTAERPPITEEIMASTMSGAERQTLIHSGVLINEDQANVGSAEAPSRKEVLSDLEHPPKTEMRQFSNLIKSKLSAAVINPPEKTKYQDKTPIRVEPPRKDSGDPYREPIA